MGQHCRRCGFWLWRPAPGPRQEPAQPRPGAG
ncbi:MAG: hypothetical protein EOO15_13480 [Chitinophagaceae bacterium]|nr:MAG: hypothetical protein EOO15_13480 [Chitinophagaceae bacterium]